MPDGYLYTKLKLRIEKETAKTGFVSCARLCHVLEQLLCLDFTERNVVTQELRAMKVIEYNPEHGWHLRTPPAHAENTGTILAEPESDIHTDMKVAEVAKPNEPIHEGDPTVDVEFGHCCHGCAKYPCEKSKAGEPADCWDYTKIER